KSEATGSGGSRPRARTSQRNVAARSSVAGERTTSSVGGKSRSGSSAWAFSGTKPIAYSTCARGESRLARAKRLSPRAQVLYAIGFVPEKAHADDPDRDLPPTLEVVRSPATLDRAATLRWLVRARGRLPPLPVASD